MSEQENAALIRSGYEMYNAALRYQQDHPDDAAGCEQRWQAARGVHAPGEAYVYTGPGGNADLWRSAAFPDRQFAIEMLLTSGDWVMTCYTFRGTHQGEFWGIAPTGTQVTISGMLMQRIESGKVVEDRDQWDRLSLLEQIGASPIE